MLRTFALIIFISSWVNLAWAGNIEIGGTGSALEALRILGAEFSKYNPNIKINVLPSLGSKGGIRALQAGRIDMAIITTATKAGELRAFNWAKTPFVIAVGNKSPIYKLTTKDIIEIYSGQVLKWPDNNNVRPIIRPNVDTVNTMLRSFSPEMAQAVDTSQRLWGNTAAVTDQDSADSIETVPGAIGIITLGQILSEKRKIRPIIIDDVEPSLVNMANGTYQRHLSYQLLTVGNPKEEIELFLAYLRSNPGRELSQNLGFLTIE